MFATILGLFLAPFRYKIAATSDQMPPNAFSGPENAIIYAFEAGAPPRTQLAELTQRSPSSTIGCANFGPEWPLLFKVHEI